MGLAHKVNGADEQAAVSAFESLRELQLGLDLAHAYGERRRVAHCLRGIGLGRTEGGVMSCRTGRNDDVPRRARKGPSARYDDDLVEKISTF